MGAQGGQGSAGTVTPHMNSYRRSTVPASAAATAAAFLSGKMGVLLSSLWLGLTVSVIFLVKFVAARVLRIRAGRGAVGEEGADPPKEEFPSISAEGSFFFQQIFQDEDREWREEVQVARKVEDDEPSSLAFKLGGQGLDDKSRNDYNEVLEASQLLDDPVRDNTKATTNVNNYRFMSEKGFVGFIQMPESKTFSIRESYVEGGLKDTFSVHPNQDARPRVPDLLDRELKDGFSSAKGFDQQVQHSLDQEEVVLSESKTSSTRGSSVASHKYEDAQTYDTESLDRELKDRFSSVKRLDQQNQNSSDDDQVVRPASKTFSTLQSHVDGYQYEDAQPYDLDAMDRDLKDRLSSVKPLDRQHQHISDDEQMVPPESQTFSTHQSHVDGRQYEDAQPYVMDRGINDRLSSVKGLDQQIHHRSDEDDEEESVGSNQEVKSGDEDGVREPMDENGVREPMGESRQAEVLIEERREAIVGDGAQATPRKSESSEAFDLESISFSSSDGYSVKDITAEYDSDDLISDRESSFGGSEDSDLEIEFQGSGKELDDLLASDEENTLREKSMNLDAGFKDELPSDDVAGGDDGEDKDDKASVDFADHFDQQLDERFVLESNEEVEKLVVEVTNRAAAITEKIRLEHMEFEKEYANDGSMDFDEEFIDLGSEKVSFLMNQSRSLSSSEHVISDKSIIQPVEKGEAKAEPEKEDSHVKGCDSSEETDLKKHEDLSKEEDDDLESLWEHQELIEQLKLDLKKAKSIGLPTIQEESDSFKLMEDLKPWKIDVELLHKDPMDELNQLYQSYKERMRKFDILNYQKMYSIGCLKLKDPLTSIGMHKTVGASIFSENFWACRRRKSENDPSQTFIKELRSDLENVYVGQMCLSWEFLWWQYEKAQELFESDHYNSQRYNQVAGEFQQLLVIMQRFLEDEPFQGPRLTYYVKNRCVNRGLLQVPMIREDSAKDYKSEATSDESLAVTSENLKYTMMTIIRLFGKFVKSDKDVEAPSVMKGLGLIKTHVELQDPSDSELLENIRDSLQKKEKKLNDLLKVGNCLVKKFKKPQEGRLSKDMFYSQVDMKLISRALTMPKISSEQLLWCHKKLSKINFVNRMLHREPAFLLFPC